MPNSDYPDLLCLHIHLPSLVHYPNTPRTGSLQICNMSAVINTWENIIFRNFLNVIFSLPISINFMTFEKSNFDMKFLSLGHYCMYTKNGQITDFWVYITVGSHSLSQIGMDNNNGQITDFWVSRASKQLNMSTSIKIWILMYYICLDLDTYYICLDFGYLLHLFGSQNILTTFIWIPKFCQL